MAAQLWPISTETFARMLDQIGYTHYHVDKKAGRLIFDVQGDVTLLRVHIIVGQTVTGETWYTRFLSFSLEFEPRKAGVAFEDLLEWLNKKNADLLFGRYYYDEDSDTVAFEVSMPGNHGLFEEDFLDLLRLATVSVDKTHEELKALAATA